MKKYLIGSIWVLCLVFNSKAFAACSGISHFLCNDCYCLWGWCHGPKALGVDFKGAHLSGKRDWKLGFPKIAIQYCYGNACFTETQDSNEAR